MHIDINLDHISIEVLQSVHADRAKKDILLPFKLENGILYILCGLAKEQFENIEEELEVFTGYTCKLIPFNQEELKKWINRYYRKNTPSKEQLEQLDHQQDFLDQIIREAKQLNSSDIHIEPYEFSARVRIRIDGLLVERYALKKITYPSLVNKIKIKASLDIAEKRLPQDGRISYKYQNKKFDIRVSILPTLHGEKIVMRLLSSDATKIDLHALGFSSENLQLFQEGIRQPNGIILISGPTGSGKTTTLYATLQALNNSQRNILTIEDPIEYTLEGINQVQLKENIGLDFASAMRSFLRQDPDIIMVGEIRDKATAEMAIRASLTGHLVFSTIHTNSAWGIIARLVDMGIPAYMLADTLNTAVAQRLVRLLCPNCKEKVPFDPKLYPTRFKSTKHVSHHYIPKGCSVCHHTGFKGRTAIHEIISVDEKIANCIKQENNTIKKLLADRGFKRLSENAFNLFYQGKTALSEIYALLASN